MKYVVGNDFWSQKIQQVCDKMIPLQLSILKDLEPDTEPSHALENFRIAAGLSEGEYHGMVFQDSDIGKWIEAASYKLMLQPDPGLEKEIDDIVAVLAKAQQPDGYLNTWYTLKEPGKRWTNLCECHELYSFGHLAEGAVAYHQATGKREFLDIMCRMADHISTVIGPEEGKLHGYPGHPEAELALYRLYKETGNKAYMKLASYFIDERGQQPAFFTEEWEKRGHVLVWTGYPGPAPDLSYHQAHLPVRQQDEAVGHAVRALYLYAGMADIAAETGDQTLIDACDRLWDNAVNRKMYVTGGLGATAQGEAFMGNYELPNDTAYAETCASVALCFFGRAMNQIRRNRAVDDIMELQLYNVILSGISLNVDRFYYVNPLEAVQGVSGVQQGLRHALPARPKWFACACCPPNVARLLTSLPEYCYQEKENSILIHQYLGGTVHLENAVITLETEYPWKGRMVYTVEAGRDIRLSVRIPGWAEPGQVTASLDGQPLTVSLAEGFLELSMDAGTHVFILDLPMNPRRLYAHPAVRQDAGCVALAYGPMVYCLEGCDNPEPLWNLTIAADSDIRVSDYDSGLLGGIRTLSAKGFRRSDSSESLYSTQKPVYEPVTLTAIPYYAWANREPRDMRVWIREV